MLIGNAVIFGLTCVVVWWTARRLFGARIGLLAAVIAPFIPQSMRYVGMTEVETLMGLFTALLAALGIAFARNATVRNGAALGTVAALATLTKPIVLLFRSASWRWSGCFPGAASARRGNSSWLQSP